MFNTIYTCIPFFSVSHSVARSDPLTLIPPGLHTPEIRNSLCLRRDGGRTPRMRDGGTTDGGTWWRESHPPPPRTWARCGSGRDPCRWREISAPAPKRESPERSRRRESDTLHAVATDPCRVSQPAVAALTDLSITEWPPHPVTYTSVEARRLQRGSQSQMCVRESVCETSIIIWDTNNASDSKSYTPWSSCSKLISKPKEHLMKCRGERVRLEVAYFFILEKKGRWMKEMPAGI